MGLVTNRNARRGTPLDENEKKPKRWLEHIEHWQIVAIFLAAYDFVAICVSYLLALWLRLRNITIYGIVTVM